jgi:hypothetical protein
MEGSSESEMTDAEGSWVDSVVAETAPVKDSTCGVHVPAGQVRVVIRFSIARLEAIARYDLRAESHVPPLLAFWGPTKCRRQLGHYPNEISHRCPSDRKTVNNSQRTSRY